MGTAYFSHEIDGLQEFARESTEKDMAAMLVSANDKSFVKNTNMTAMT